MTRFMRSYTPLIRSNIELTSTANSSSPRFGGAAAMVVAPLVEGGQVIGHLVEVLLTEVTEGRHDSGADLD